MAATMPLTLGPIDGISIVGGGTAFPQRSLTNVAALRAVAPWALGGRSLDDDRLAFLAAGVEETLGVRERAWAHVPGTPIDHAHEETTLDLALAAGRRALADAGLEASDVPLVICATSTPHRMTSTLSAAVGAGLGAHAACFDVRTGCSAGLFAIATSSLYLAAGVRRALVIGAEVFSKILPKESKIAAASLGDGAAAIVLEKREGSASLVAASLATDGTLGGLITTDGALPPTEAEIARGGYMLSGTPEELSAVVPGKYAQAMDAVLARAGMSGADIDLFVPHQTSAGVMAEIARRAGIDAARTFVNLDRHANIGAAGVLGALVEARAEGRLPDGGHVLLAAVGGGMSWAALVLRC